MIRKNKSDRRFWETAWLRYIDQNKYDRGIYKKFGDMYDIPMVGRLKKKFKSIQHYLINPDEKEAWHSLRQFMDEVEAYILSKENIKE